MRSTDSIGTGSAPSRARSSKADIIITATGFNLNALGDIDFVIDGKPLVFSEEGDADASPGGSGYASVSLGGSRKFQPWLSHARHAFAAEAREQAGNGYIPRTMRSRRSCCPRRTSKTARSITVHQRRCVVMKSPLSRLRVLSGGGRGLGRAARF